MGSVEIKRITAEDTYILRHQLLRAHQSVEQVRYPGDADASTVHFGAFEANELVGICSLYRVTNALLPVPDCWQLRAMATLGRVRGKGYGFRLLNDAEACVVNSGGRCLWANARSSALGFYIKAGYHIIGDEFTLPDIGPHHLVYKTLN